jgi:hypothetical protein
VIGDGNLRSQPYRIVGGHDDPELAVHEPLHLHRCLVLD